MQNFSSRSDRVDVYNPLHIAFVPSILLWFHIKQSKTSLQQQCTHHDLHLRNSHGRYNKAELTKHSNCHPSKKKKKRRSSFPHSILRLFITPDGSDWAHRKWSISATGREEGGQSDPLHVNQAFFMRPGHPRRWSALVVKENSGPLHMS